MKAHINEFRVERMATVLDVSRSGFYAWLKRIPSPFARQREKFDAAVRERFLVRKGRFGRRRLTKELLKQGVGCSVNRVARSMKRQKLQGRQSRKYIVTTESKHSFRVADNLLNRQFIVDAPNRVWVTDITYLPGAEGHLYLVVFIDLFSRKVVGWHVSTSLRHETVLIALFRAMLLRGVPTGLIVHSDRGVQYCCDGFREVIDLHAITQSMSRKGDCWDNAVAESFFARVKKELPRGTVFASVEEARRYLFEYIEIDYHEYHPHGTLGMLTPNAFEQQYWASHGTTLAKVG